jgi:hypothetical protein
VDIDALSYGPAAANLGSGGHEGDVVIAETLVSRHNCQPFRECLGYEHVVERIVMMADQLSRCDPVSDRYWQGYKASCLDLMFKVIRCRELKSSDAT